MSTTMKPWRWMLISLTPVVLALVAACGGAQAPSNATPTPVKATPTAALAKTTPTATPTKAASSGTSTAGGSAATPSTSSSGETVQVQIAPRAFVPDKLSFQAGKTYTLVFNASEEFHTFTVADLGINILLDAGKSAIHVVTINKAGTFNLVCVVHEGEGMVGSVTVR